MLLCVDPQHGGVKRPTASRRVGFRAESCEIPNLGRIAAKQFEETILLSKTSARPRRRREQNKLPEDRSAQPCQPERVSLGNRTDL